MTEIAEVPRGDRSVHKSAQHLRWFIRAFEQQVEATARELRERATPE